MNPRQRLATICQDEARAYGYTLTIWGAGGLLIHAFGDPNPFDVFGYIFGAIIGYGLLVAYTFRRPLTTGTPDFGEDDEAESGNEFIAASTVHFIATPGNLLVAYAFILLARGTSVPVWAVFFLIGLEATTVYNLLTVLEDYIGRHLPSPRAQHGE